jgi:hypothetical protein
MPPPDRRRLTNLDEEFFSKKYASVQIEAYFFLPEQRSNQTIVQKSECCEQGAQC